MAIIKKALAPSLCVSLLAGCAWIEIADVERQSNTGTAFDRTLYDGYLDLSRKEYGNADFLDQHRFADRARLAAAGERFEPEEISFRSLSEADAAELGRARARLMAALEAGAAETMPKEAGRAQVMFDCWMEEAEEGDADVGTCKGEFLTAMQAAETPPAPAAEAAPPPLPGPYFVMFDLGSAALGEQAAALVDKVAEVWGRAEAKRLVVTGHTDMVGSSAFNQALSEKRAEAVAIALIDKGVPARDIAMRARGQEEPIMPTADGEPAELNRRVEIAFER